MKRLLLIYICVCIMLAGCNQEENLQINSTELPFADQSELIVETDELEPAIMETEDSEPETAGNNTMDSSGNNQIQRLDVHNWTNTTIEQIVAVLGEDEYILCGELAPGEYLEIPEPDLWTIDIWAFTAPEPSFHMIVSGQKVDISRAKSTGQIIGMEHLALNKRYLSIGVYQDQDGFYFSPENLQDILSDPETADTLRTFVYLPSVQRWMRQHYSGQAVYFVHISEDELYTYFPDYNGDELYQGWTALVTSDAIELETVKGDIALKDAGVDYYGVMESEVLSIEPFTPQDVKIVRADHTYYPYQFYRYTGTDGTVYRQFLGTSPNDLANEFLFDNGNGELRVYDPEW